MLFAINNDVPGVIGKVGSILGESKINIGGYILSRIEDNQAFSVIRVDNFVSEKTIKRLEKISEITSLKQLSCNA
mgnify:FL=1